jgi:glycosyltransferase involved in cell wall biosynthesis
MPSFNHGSYIREAIDSILAQDYTSVQCIVVDGGSTDGTLATLESYGDRIQWVSEPDQGLYDAVNKGWAMARGEWLGWINADDKLCPGAISRLMQAVLREDPPVDLVYGDYYRFAADGGILERVCCGAPDGPAMLRNGNCIFIGASLIRREFIERIGAFDLRYALAADYDLLVRAVHCGRALHVADPVSMFRMHEDSKSQNSRWRMWEETLAISEELAGRRHHRLRARYALDRAVHVVATDRLLWRRELVPLRRLLRRVWSRP